jgi:hypothetical protein
MNQLLRMCIVCACALLGEACCQCSVLLLPEHLWMRHAAVVAAALLVTWFVVEQVTPFVGSDVA